MIFRKNDGINFSLIFTCTCYIIGNWHALHVPSARIILWTLNPGARRLSRYRCWPPRAAGRRCLNEETRTSRWCDRTASPCRIPARRSPRSFSFVLRSFFIAVLIRLRKKNATGNLERKSSSEMSRHKRDYITLSLYNEIQRAVDNKVTR